jgi:hypothetical protein
MRQNGNQPPRHSAYAQPCHGRGEEHMVSGVPEPGTPFGEGSGCRTWCGPMVPAPASR